MYIQILFLLFQSKKRVDQLAYKLEQPLYTLSDEKLIERIAKHGNMLNNVALLRLTCLHLQQYIPQLSQHNVKRIFVFQVVLPKIS